MDLARDIVLAGLFFLIAAVLTSGRGLAQDAEVKVCRVAVRL